MKGHCAVDVNKQYLYAFSHIFMKHRLTILIYILHAYGQHVCDGRFWLL